MNYLEKNVAAGVQLPEGGEGRSKKSLTVEHARALLEKAEDSDLIFVLLLMTGLRPEEATGLTWPRVELLTSQKAIVRVREVAQKVRGGEWFLAKPKTKRAARDVPFPAWLYHDLMRLKEQNLFGENKLNLIFPAPHDQPLSNTALNNMFRQLLKRAELPTDYTPYSLRYAYNTFLYLMGVPDKPRIALMGHVNEEFKKEVYVKVMPEMFEA